MLSREQIDFYKENGYLMVENAVTPEQLAALRDTTYRLIDGSRSCHAGTARRAARHDLPADRRLAVVSRRNSSPRCATRPTG